MKQKNSSSKAFEVPSFEVPSVEIHPSVEIASYEFLSFEVPSVETHPSVEIASVEIRPSVEIASVKIRPSVEIRPSVAGRPTNVHRTRGFFKGTFASFSRPSSHYPAIWEPHVDGIFNVDGDDHCGFRVVEKCLGLPDKDGWKSVRERMVEEFMANQDS
ncbi:hypothetical protein Scep_009932 [Stephania cephalantha]|uniref:Uncharacterized protein n=1 Tax=Stephania cephalantha TaxID=152367 RepID=A0AAP0JUH7_9MAGN